MCRDLFGRAFLLLARLGCFVRAWTILDAAALLSIRSAHDPSPAINRARLRA
jgi:hypothetical protein